MGAQALGDYPSHRRGHPYPRSFSPVGFYLRPVILKRDLHAAQHINRLIRFVGHRIWRSDSTGDFERAEQVRIVLSTSAYNNNDATVVATRPPNVKVVVAADGWRQTQAATEHVDRRSFAVVIPEEHGARPIVDRQRPIDGGHLFGHFPPAEHIGVVLREHVKRLMLARGGREADCLLV